MQKQQQFIFQILGRYRKLLTLTDIHSQIFYFATLYVVACPSVPHCPAGATSRRPTIAAGVQAVTNAAIAVLAALDVVDRFIDGLLVDHDASHAASAQRLDLCDGDTAFVAVGVGSIDPTAG